MYRDHVVAAVVPAYNEEKLIGSVVASMPEVVDYVIVVDDGSSDATSEAVRAVGDPRVHLIRHEPNQGVGAAIVTGHRKALELDADISVVMAGDGQSDPQYLPDLLEPLVSGGYGFTKANRFFSATSYDGMPFVRVAGSIALTFMTKMASGYWNTVDPQNGYTAVRTDVLERLDLDRLSRGYSFENDMLIWLNILDVPIQDVPVPAVYGEEVSTMHLGKDGARIAMTLFKGYWKRMWRKYVLWSFSPVALMLLAGLFMLLVTGVALVAAIFMVSSARPLPSATVISVVGPGLMSFYLLVQSMMLDIQATPRVEGHAAPHRVPGASIPRQRRSASETVLCTDEVASTEAPSA